MTGNSMLSSRRLPASLSSRPMSRSVVAGDGLDGVDHFLVVEVVGYAGEGGVAAVGEDGDLVLDVAAECGDEAAALVVVERAEVHFRSPSVEGATISRRG